MKDIELLVSLCQLLELLVVTFLSIQDQCGIFRKYELNIWPVSPISFVYWGDLV